MDKGDLIKELEARIEKLEERLAPTDVMAAPKRDRDYEVGDIVVDDDTEIFMKTGDDAWAYIDCFHPFTLMNHPLKTVTASDIKDIL